MWRAHQKANFFKKPIAIKMVYSHLLHVLCYIILVCLMVMNAEFLDIAVLCCTTGSKLELDLCFEPFLTHYHFLSSVMGGTTELSITWTFHTSYP